MEENAKRKENDIIYGVGDAKTMIMIRKLRRNLQIGNNLLIAFIPLLNVTTQLCFVCDQGDIFFETKTFYMFFEIWALMGQTQSKRSFFLSFFFF